MSNDQLIAEIKDIGDPFFTAKELADRVPITRQSVNSQLKELLDKGILDRKRCGSGYGWWLVREP